jgi:hypothetical protein
MTSIFSNNINDGGNGRGTAKIDSTRYYAEYHGHLVEHLKVLLPALRESSDSMIWTAGDSSLDNKYWFSDKRSALGAYDGILDPPVMNADVTYWLNRLALEHASARDDGSKGIATINTAIEATTLQQRTWKLLAQDEFLRDNIQPTDTLIVSIGGNDVALAPTPCTIGAMLSLVKMSQSCMENSCTCWTPPCNEHCYGCGPVAIASCCSSFPPCLGYTNHLFGTRIQHYVEKLTAKTKPKRVLVCMIYYLDEAPTPSWAGKALECLGYDDDPEQLQFLIRKMYVEAISKIRVEGTTVIPIPLFDALDGKTSDDSVARVEPSSQGGKKMAGYLLKMIERDEQLIFMASAHAQEQARQSQPPAESSYMLDRG